MCTDKMLDQLKMSSSVDFDQILTMVGEKGKYQTIMFIVLCIPATVPVAFLAFSNLFTTATPDHWCKPAPIFHNLNLSDEDLRTLTIPYEIKNNGEKIYDKCHMYDLNSTNIYDELFKRKMDIEWFYKFEEYVTNGSIAVKKCDNGWVYDKKYYDNTLVTEMNLVCDDSWSPQTSTALFYVGSLFGNVFFGWVADRWGRRTSMLWMIILEVFISIMTCFPKDFQSYLVLRTVGGLFFPALYQIPFILGIEMMAPKHRPLAGMLICTMFAAALSLLSLLAFLLRDWFKLSIAISVPFLALYSYYWIIPESPRWLFSKGRVDEADDIIQTMAKCNGVKIPKKLLHQLHLSSSTRTPLVNEHINGDVQHESDVVEQKTKFYIDLNKKYDLKDDIWSMQITEKVKSIDEEVGCSEIGDVVDEMKNSTTGSSKSVCLQTDCLEKSDQRVGFLDIFHYPNVRKKFFLLTFVWIANAVVYNGLSYNATNLGVNDFLAFFISAAIEFPSNLIAWKLMDVWGRKWLLCSTLAIGGLGCLACMFVPEERVWVTVTFAMIGKFGVAASFSVFYVFVGESFPTVLRSQAMGVSSLVASIGLLVFPYILQLDQISRALPMIILGILSLLGSFATIFLPDTLNASMPQTLEEGEKYGKDHRIFDLPKRKPATLTDDR